MVLVKEKWLSCRLDGQLVKESLGNTLQEPVLQKLTQLQREELKKIHIRKSETHTHTHTHTERQ